MKRIGVLSGTTMMERSRLLHSCQPRTIQTPCGEVAAMIGNDIVFILRHGQNPDEYILPHLVNYQANLQALQSLSVTEVIGVNSTGSLKKELSPGTIIIPDDFITLAPTPSIHTNRAVHITPSLNESVRTKLIASAKQCKLPVVDRGVYWQVTGPRLETKAEIRMMANYADIVGMTMANEAVLALEMGLAYASVCSVDNYGNGLLNEPLSQEEIVAGARKNAEWITCLISRYLEVSVE